jgi:hypothetical protein
MAAAEMIARLFHARTAAHMAHLQTRSFAEHKALNEFYEEVVDLADDFAETYQGMFGLIMSYPECEMPPGQAITWIETLRQWLKKYRTECCKGEPALENIHDSVVALCASTLYKLRFLDNPVLDSMEMEMEPEVEEYREPAKTDEYMKMSKW